MTFSLNQGKGSGDEVTWTDLRDASEVASADVVIDQRMEGRVEERMIKVYEMGDEMDHDVFTGPGIKGMQAGYEGSAKFLFGHDAFEVSLGNLFGDIDQIVVHGNLDLKRQL